MTHPALMLAVLNVCPALVLALGVYSTLKLKIANQWHHLWLGFFAFPLSLEPVELAIRAVFWVPLCDDALQHWLQARRYVKKNLALPAVAPSVQELDALYESPLHRLYAFVVEHL